MVIITAQDYMLIFGAIHGGNNLSYLFTSESVSEGHPDKVADAISDAVLDYMLRDSNRAVRCACETLVTTNRVVLAGEYKGLYNHLEVESIVRNVIKDIGYEQYQDG